MPVSKAQQQATAKYKRSNYDRMEILLAKGRKSDLQAHAAARGESLNGFVNRAIDEAMQRDKATGRVPAEDAPTEDAPTPANASGGD